MKKIITLLCFSLLVITTNAQNEAGDTIFTSIEQAPTFTSGKEGFKQFLSHYVRYPDSAFKNHVQGRVLVQLLIEKDGQVTDLKVVQSVSPDLDREALRVLGLSPRWMPGIQNGKAVRVYFVVPFNFSLDNPSLLQTKAADKPDLAKTEPGNPNTLVRKYTGVSPKFQDGSELFSHFVNYKIKYPEKARIDRTEGRVMVAFIIEKDGSLSHIHIIKSLSPETDEEALRMVSKSPKWKPGMEDGKPVRVYYDVPVIFSLD